MATSPGPCTNLVGPCDGCAVFCAQERGKEGWNMVIYPWHFFGILPVLWARGEMVVGKRRLLGSVEGCARPSSLTHSRTPSSLGQTVFIRRLAGADYGFSFSHSLTRSLARSLACIHTHLLLCSMHLGKWWVLSSAPSALWTFDPTKVQRAHSDEEEVGFVATLSPRDFCNHANV